MLRSAVALTRAITQFRKEDGVAEVNPGRSGGLAQTVSRHDLSFKHRSQIQKSLESASYGCQNCPAAW